MPPPPPPPSTTPGFLGGRLRQLPKERPHLKRCTKVLCSAFLTVLLLAGVVLFVAYLAVRPHRPRFHLVGLSAAGVQGGGGGGGGGPVLLSGELSVRNPNQDIAFFFDRLYLSVHYRNADVVKDRDLTGGPLYQPPNTTRPVTFAGVPVAGGDMARDAAAGGAPVPFTVKVRSRIRVKLAFWGSHWHPLHVSCDVAVGPDGQLLPEYQQKRCSIDFDFW